MSLATLRPAPVPGGWRATALAVRDAPLDALAGARGHLFPFVPVFLGLGIGLYFALPAEPGARQWFGLAAGALVALGLALRGPERWQPVALALALVVAGVMMAGWRAHSVAAPVLGWRYYGPVEGRVVAVDRSVSDALRLTLDQVVLHDVAVARVPARVRVSLHGDAPLVDPVPGAWVMLTGHLGPPGGPVEPGGFDFRRIAWFDGLGAVGYTRNPVMTVAPPEPGLALAVTRLRMRMSAGIRAAMPGEPGGFVAAILTGDRSGVGQATTEALRGSNLAHLLAISGLHMGLLTGVVYGALRALLALVPALALRYPIRKWAALGALAAASFYLLLSGGNVATQRAFIMAAVMLGAVLADRRALSLRSVALAAVVILLWRPEALLSAGFQMSFAATVALVAVFGAMRRRRQERFRNPVPGKAPPRRWPGWLRGLGGVALCSLVAGLATAPIAAAHFHRMADYGLLANMLSMPLMGTLVMPSAVLAAALWPLGLEWVGLALMEAGTRWILGVAHWVSGFAGAVRPVAAPPAWVLPAMALGALWLVLWPGRARLAGAGAVMLALAGWGQAPRPAILIAESGAMIGVMGHEGRAGGRVLSRPRGEGFVVRNWLQADGDMASQTEAAARPGMMPGEGGAVFWLAGERWVHLTGGAAPEALPDACAGGGVIVTDARWPGPPPGPCRLIDATALRASGARAGYLNGGGIEWRLAHAVAGARPWTTRRRGR
ncbi:MAG: ComEC/Rec2 family competence protein [Pararhodobacter sp.]